MTRIISVILCIIFCFSIPGICKDTKSGKQSSVAVQKKKKRVVLRSKLSNVQVQIKKVKEKIHQKEKEKLSVVGQLTATESRLEETKTVLQSNTIKLANAKNDLHRTILRLERTKKQLARRKNLLERRIVDIYEGDDLGYINVILGSRDMWSFLTRAYYLKQILQNDTELINQIETDKKLIERDQKRQKSRVTEIESIQSDLVTQRYQVAELVMDKRNQLQKIENSKELYENAIDELLAMSRQIEASIRRLQNTGTASKPFRGGLSLPVSGPMRSRFGYRVHPVTRVYKLHTGVDISARSGTPIHAAASGTVILSGWYGAYGNAVVIDHGGRVSTLYGHCSRLAVRNGQSVKKGQVVGYVGSTGLSTGPHCHFEKRINGTPVNPL